MAVGIPSHLATPVNVLNSLLGWIHGGSGGDYAESAAWVMDAAPTQQDPLAGQLQRFCQIYSTAPLPTLRGVGGRPEANIYEVLRDSGSPLLVCEPPMPNTVDLAMGSGAGTARWQVQVTAYCGVYRGDGPDALDLATSRVQLINATQRLTRLLTWHDGNFPVFNFATAVPQESRLGTAMVDLQGVPVTRADQLRTDFILQVRFLASAN